MYFCFASNYDGFSESKRLLLQLLHVEVALACDDVYETLKDFGYTEEELDMFSLICQENLSHVRHPAVERKTFFRPFSLFGLLKKLYNEYRKVE